MDIKYNINKIHGDLIMKFDSVEILEKSNHDFSNYFELIATKDKKDVKIIISKKDIENDTFKWSYYANPLIENSDLVNRVSNVNTMFDDVSDIVDNNRFNREYLETIKNDNK